MTTTAPTLEAALACACTRPRPALTAWVSGSPTELREWARWGNWNVRMTAFIYVFSIWVVATTLFVAVNEIEPDRRLALALFLIVLVSAAAIAGRLMP